MGAEVFGQRPTGVARIGPKHFEPRLDTQDFRQDFQRTGPIRDAGGGDHHTQHQAQRIYHQRPFSPSDLFARIVTAHSGVVSHFNTLRVEDRGTRGFFFRTARALGPAGPR